MNSQDMFTDILDRYESALANSRVLQRDLDEAKSKVHSLGVERDSARSATKSVNELLEIKNKWIERARTRFTDAEWEAIVVNPPEKMPF